MNGICLQPDSLGKAKNMKIIFSGQNYLKLKNLDDKFFELDVKVGKSYIELPRNHRPIKNRTSFQVTFSEIGCF